MSGRKMIPKSVDDAYNDIVYSLRTIREINHITQEHLSQLTGISRSHISRVESGDHKPSLEFAVKICTALGCDLAVVFSLRNVETKAKTNNGTIERELFSGED